MRIGSPPHVAHPTLAARTVAGLLLFIFLGPMAPTARADDPDPDLSFFVPQAGPVNGALEGAAATKFFRACPNNDGVSSLPNSARIQVKLVGPNGAIFGHPASMIYVLFNGGTLAQNYSGVGADSIIANGTWNQNPPCPDVTRLTADAATDASGVTYITFEGTSAVPGVGQRDFNRKWGHYDSDLPVYVETASGSRIRLSGRLLPGDTAGNYKLRIKNFDLSGGLGASLNQGETVTTIDYNAMVANIGKSSIISYWLDYDQSGGVHSTDFNMLVYHLLHNCVTPNNP